MEEVTRFCTECGTPINANAKFCPNCGAPQGENGGRPAQCAAPYAPSYDEPSASAHSKAPNAAVTYTPTYTAPTGTQPPTAEPQPPAQGKRPSYKAVGILAAAVLLVLVLFLWKPFDKGHPIVGKWEPMYGDGYMEFKRDGALIVSGGGQSLKGRYKIVSEDCIRIIPPAGYDEDPENMTFSLEGDILYIDGSMFQRMS